MRESSDLSFLSQSVLCISIRRNNSFHMAVSFAILDQYSQKTAANIACLQA